MEHIDVLIVGAGLSGIGAACHLQKRSPQSTYAIFESRGQLGGTWDLFRYPGVRSDSDMHTLGYEFKPWLADKAIADGPSILRYIRETAEEFGVIDKIRYHHRVVAASWLSSEARWLLEIEHPKTGARHNVSCHFLFMCAGYYSYREPFQPDIPGLENFTGPVVHPQSWPATFDYTSKRIIIVGSGATAITLLPALAQTAAAVTMVQRSPSYILAWPEKDAVANTLRRLLPESVAYRMTRWKNTGMQQYFYYQSQKRPNWIKKQLIRRARRALGPSFDVETHLTPRYKPWEQRMCLAPDGDFFKAIRDGRATIETDHIAMVTESGVTLRSGKTIDADVLVTATGLKLVTLGEVHFQVDGLDVDFSKTVIYRGFAYSDIPNLCSTFGYVNASWTLRSDLIARYVCRLLNHMHDTGTRQCVPRLRQQDKNMELRPFLDKFTPGYIRRAYEQFPKQGAYPPWTNPQDYGFEKKALTQKPIDDGVMTFT